MSLFSRKNTGDKQGYERLDSKMEYVSEERIISQNGKVGEEIKQETAFQTFSNSKFPTGNKSADLIILIGKALDEWARMYHLQGMPAKVVFGQALALMTAWYKDLK